VAVVITEVSEECRASIINYHEVRENDVMAAWLED
jgi:hypothetical protein